MSSNPETTLRGSLILLSFKNAGIWGLPPPSRGQSINLQNSFTGEARVGDGGIGRRKGLQPRQPEAGAGQPLPPTRGACWPGPLLCAGGRLQGQGPTESPEVLAFTLFFLTAVNDNSER